jgi:hypothetical protein
MENTIQSSNYGGKSGRRLVKGQMATTIDSTASLNRKSYTSIEKTSLPGPGSYNVDSKFPAGPKFVI